MKFFAILAVLLFAFASVSLSAISGAVRSDSSEVSLSQSGHVAFCQVENGTDRSSIFRPCSKRINGQVVACHFDAGLPIGGLNYRFKGPARQLAVVRAAELELSLKWAHYRPPQLA